MRFGCCANPETGDVLAQAGYDYLELSVARHLQPEVADRDWAPLRQTIEAQPLPVEAFNTFLPGDLKVTGLTVDEDRIARYMRVAFERVARLGGADAVRPSVVVYGSSGSRNVPDGFPRGKAWQQLIGFLQRVGREAARVGIAVCIEPLNRAESNVINSVAEGTELAREVDHPRVRVLADLYHMVVEEEPIAEHLAQAGDWIRHVHVADTGRRPPGTGDYPYPAFFRALWQTGYDERCSVECRWTDLATECGPALEFLRQVWDKSTP
jgi:sugar phosphate isomerase/epimerase